MAARGLKPYIIDVELSPGFKLRQARLRARGATVNVPLATVKEPDHIGPKRSNTGFTGGWTTRLQRTG